MIIYKKISGIQEIVLLERKEFILLKRGKNKQAKSDLALNRLT